MIQPGVLIAQPQITAESELGNAGRKQYLARIGLCRLRVEFRAYGIRFLRGNDFFLHKQVEQRAVTLIGKGRAWQCQHRNQ